MGVYELAPLRQADVSEAAKLNGLDSEKFVEKIRSCDAESFAIKPITLKMLINIFKKEESFPASKLALYNKGCLSLAEESNDSRRDARRFGTLSSEQRLLVAARIAALSVFGGKNAIWTGPVNGGMSEEDLTLADIAGGYEQVDGTNVEINELALREILSDTGFFSSRGAHRAGWSHQTYAEYLAAYYLTHRKVGSEQSISLLCHPEDAEKKLIPQLTEVAAWLASMNGEIFSHIMSADPETLLKSDLTTIGNEVKKDLLRELLALYESGDAVDNDWGLRDHYGKLVHSGLAEQLRHFINDSSKNRVVRRVAIDIAEACNLTVLQPECR
ncbi:MAG: hypothetical protein J7L25_07550 [Deltaproteobacteria bacterium]|nr:hypothetical protein [Candidatus Tharpella aukensis]